jgi:hypothetical protein
MDQILEERLIKGFPRLYRNGMYFECHDGWFALLWRLSARLEDLISQGPGPEQKRYFAMQVKEKWGLLSFYLSNETEEMSQAINAAWEESGHICEECGAPGTLLHKGRWALTRCLMHAPAGSQPIEAWIPEDQDTTTGQA